MWHHRVGENQPAPLILTLGPDPGATLTMYMLLGAIAVRFFGRNVDASCNLNWRTHANPTISFVVSLFPAVDCLSVFPINALFLSNNLMSIAFGDKWRSGGVRRRVRVGSRLLCILPPFACALSPCQSWILITSHTVGWGGQWTLLKKQWREHNVRMFMME